MTSIEYSVNLIEVIRHEGEYVVEYYPFKSAQTAIEFAKNFKLPERKHDYVNYRIEISLEGWD